MNAPLRRGACPGLSAPMQTGDGLLVRLMPLGTIPLAAFAKLCAAARTYGNGIMEITARGSIQVRGLSPASAPRFAAAVAALGIAAVDGVAVHAGPLAGLDPDEILDTEKLTADLRRAVAQRVLAVKLAPKISIVVDGGGVLSLDGLSADVRLRAELRNGQAVLELSVGGGRTGAAHLGFVAPADAVAAAERMLDVIAQYGRTARARDIIAGEGATPFKAALGDLLLSANTSACHDAAGGRHEVIGAYRLRDGAFAFGLGLAFGRADTPSLEQLTAASARGATGIRTASGRALIVIGLAPEALDGFAADAERLGFVVCAEDPRRFVFACAGASVCASGHIAARAIAPRIAADHARLLGGSFTIHVSGCAKGCAHSAPAALTVVGTPGGCTLIANGVARDAPFAVVPMDKLAAAIAEYARASTREAPHV